MRGMFMMAIVVAVSGMAPVTGPAQDDAEAARVAEARQRRERAFEEMLTGAELTGRWTLDGEPADAPVREERYSITSVTKIAPNTWRFDCRVRYGDRDVTVPIPLKVAWAGDTPMIGLTDMKIPGLGTYTARVLLYRDKYAGTWSGGEHGGHLLGTIERPAGRDESDD